MRHFCGNPIGTGKPLLRALGRKINQSIKAAKRRSESVVKFWYLKCACWRLKIALCMFYVKSW